jgi:hypothetical protein
MTGTELITDIRNELLEPVAGFWTDAELLLWINRAEQDFVGRVRGLESQATVGTVIGQSEYPLPANWMSAVHIFYNDLQDNVDSWRPLQPTDLQELALQDPNFLSTETTSRGKPDRYFIWDKKIVLYPTPDVTGDANVKMYYKSKPVSLSLASQSINVDDSLSGGIKAYVLWKAWTKEKEFELAKDQQELYYSFVRDGLRWVKLQALNKRHNIDVASGRPYF